MILAIWNNEVEMTIDQGKIVTTDPYFEQSFNLLVDPVPGPAEGDPDMVYYKRLKKFYPDLSIVKYIPMEIDESVVY